MTFSTQRTTFSRKTPTIIGDWLDVTVSIRPAAETDLPALARMNKRLIDDEGSRNPMPVEALQARMQAWLSADWRIDLFLHEAAVAGYAVYQLRPDEYAPDQVQVYLRQFYIERDRRGRGLGALAFQALIGSRFPPGSRVVIEALASNPRGHHFWSKLGFQSYATTMHFQQQR